MLVLDFVKDIVIATLGQMAALFGGIILFGFLMNITSRLTFETLARSFGRKGIYCVAWLGTPIHELGHAIFCLIFVHKITDIEFFKPDPITGTLGYVYHKWNPSNPWQVMGNFFIGIGPIILGCLALLTTFYFLIPNSPQFWDSILDIISETDQQQPIGSYFAVLKGSSFVMLEVVFTISNLTNWRFWSFCYVSICIASNIRLSLLDLKGAVSGLGLLVLPFLAANFIGLATGFGRETYLTLIASALGTIQGLFAFALVMAFLGFALAYLISAVYVKVRWGYLLNPL